MTAKQQDIKLLPFRLIPEERHKDFQFLKDLLNKIVKEECKNGWHSSEISMMAQQMILFGFRRVDASVLDFVEVCDRCGGAKCHLVKIHDGYYMHSGDPCPACSGKGIVMRKEKV